MPRDVAHIYSCGSTMHTGINFTKVANVCNVGTDLPCIGKYIVLSGMVLMCHKIYAKHRANTSMRQNTHPHHPHTTSHTHRIPIQTTATQ